MLYDLNQYSEGEMPAHALRGYTWLGLPVLPCWCIPTLTRRPVCWHTTWLQQHPLAPIW